MIWYSTIGLLLTGGLLSLFFRKNEVYSNTAAYLCSAFAALCSGFLAIKILLTNQTLIVMLPKVLPYTQVTMKIDNLAGYFILVISVLTLAVSVYSFGYGQEYFGKGKIGQLGFMFNIFILTMLLVVTANNILLFLFAWELMSLVSFLLVLYEHEYIKVRNAGLVYLIMTHIGSLFLVLGFLIMYQQTGSFEFDQLAVGVRQLSPELKNIIFIFMLIGFGTKAGIVPLHVWLPRAHPAAPSHVSALMSGIMIKTALYGLIRVLFHMLGSGSVWWGVLILILGVISALLGVLYALMEQDLKRLLAFSSVENIGIIFLGLGAAIIFKEHGTPMLSAIALTAGLYHLFNHAVFKSLLFMGAGAVHMATHTRKINKLGGLIKTMPWTALFFLIGSASISVLPPFNGFVSEWLTFQSLLALSFNISDTTIKIMAPVAGSALALTGGLVAACFIKAFGISFLALPRSKNAEKAREVNLSMRIGMGILAGLCILMGIFPSLIFRLLDGVSLSLAGAGVYGQLNGGAWLSVLNIPNASGKGISMDSLSLGILLVLAIPVVLLITRFIGGRTKRSKDETWNCGKTLIPAMEYTATSFSNPIRIIFRYIFWPSQDIIKEDKGSPYFTKSIKYRSRITPVFEEYLYRPINWAVIYISDKMGSVQSGSIHIYLTYILATIIALLLFAR
ncbi:MAG: hydrogenase 4 subunit B [Peptococcaceae bacterium]|nr:hydrogenase 4 subunit B [Peptococcaceae bacterium]